MADQEQAQGQEDNNQAQDKEQENESQGGQPAPSKADEIEDKMNQLYARMKKAENEAKELKSEKERLMKEQEEKKLLEEKEYDKLLSQNKEEIEAKEKEIAKLQGYETVLQAYYDKELEEIPEDRRGAIPEDYPLAKRLEWIVNNKHLLVDKKAVSNQALPKNKENLTEIDQINKRIESLKEKKLKSGLSEAESMELITISRKLAESKNT